MFNFKLLNNRYSPPILKSFVHFNHDVVQHAHNLRSRNNLALHNVNTKFGDRSFQYVMPKIINCTIINRLNLPFINFKSDLITNLNNFYNNIITIFPLFDLKTANYNYFQFKLRE